MIASINLLSESTSDFRMSENSKRVIFGLTHSLLCSSAFVMGENFLFESERLCFRELNFADVDNLQLIFSDPVAMQYYPSTKDIEATRNWIQWQLDNYKSDGHGLWAVHLKESGEFIGQCGVIPNSPRGFRENDVGYLFVRKFWGQGYATEAASRVRDYAFSKLDLDTLVVYMGPKNTPSRKVAERIGGKLECIEPPERMRWKLETCVYRLNRNDFVGNS